MPDWLTFSLKYVPQLVSLVFSSFAFAFTFREERNKRFNLDVKIVDETIPEWEVDRTSNESPDKYWQQKYRLFVTVVITNNSSRPVTINMFSLNNKYKFGIYTEIGEYYKVTLKNGWTTKTLSNGAKMYAGGQEKFQGLNVDNETVLHPIFTIAPYELASGLLFFTFNESLVGENTIKIHTSRGDKEFPITIDKQLVSKLETDYSPPDLDQFKIED